MPKGEMDAHLNSADRSSGNRRNGSTDKVWRGDSRNAS